MSNTQATDTKPQIAPAQKDAGLKKDPNSNTNNVLHHVGMVVNGFEIQKLIGQGKFSYVFKAKRV